jgi:hypothetical protein
LFLKIFFGISLVAFVFLYYYEWRVQKIRRTFLEKVKLKRFLEMVDQSISSVSSLLSFSAVVLSIWAGFGLLASPNIIRVYGEDIFMIFATASLCLVFFAITLYVYHLCQFFSLPIVTEKEAFEKRKELFRGGETFFIFGTVFFLLTFLYSFVTLSAVLSPTPECLIIVIVFGVVSIVFLIFMTVRKFWPIVSLIRRI